MSTATITTAARQYATRPPDERFSSVQDLIAFSLHEKDSSLEKRTNLKDLRAIPATLIPTDGTATNASGIYLPPTGTPNPPIGTDVALQSPKGSAILTHWSFGQLARTISAPGGYLRSLSPQLAADCINEGIQKSPIGTTANVLLRANGDGKPPTVRACTSETYGRAWDAPLYSSVQSMVLQGRSVSGDGWQNAPTWAGEQIAGFRGDRDSFLLQIDGGSIVNDPSAGNDGRMYRALMIGNSEVGAGSAWFEVALMRFICGNWMLWGATIGMQYRRRHVGPHVMRDFVREVANLSWRFTQRSASQDEAVIRGLIDHEIASTKAGIVDELRKLGCNKEQAEQAYDRAEATEKASPRSFWGIAQGLTRISQDDGTKYQDERMSLDKIAGQILAIGAKRISAAVRV